MLAFTIGLTLMSLVLGQEVTNLLVNPSFEDDLKGTWKANGFQMSQYDRDKLHGTYSMLCSDRTSDLDGPVQDLGQLKQGGRYALHGYVKLLDDKPGKLWQNFKVSIKFSLTDADTAGVDSNYILAYRGFAQKSDGWISLIGNINAPMKAFDSARFSIKGPEAGVRFLVDNLTLWEVPEHPDWESTAHTNIDTYRKSNIHFQITLPPGIPASEVEIQVDHKKHLFAFGCKIETDLALKAKNENFRSLFFSLFNWATVGAYKWRFDKGTHDNPDFSEAVDTTNVLVANGLKVRAHSILWGVEKNIPDWVLQLDKGELQTVLNDHITHMMNIAKGKVSQWDIQNEYIHGHYYEEKLQDPNVTINAFKTARPLDPVPKLYLNDFQAVTTGAQTEDLYDLAERLKAANTGIQGLGIQGHTKDYIKPDPTMIWKRLDRLAETGLELFMTEFDLGWDDDVERADWFEDSIRAFFAHPGLSGVMLWGILKERMRYSNEYLIKGDNLEFAEPGERWACLVKKEWSTHVTRKLSESGLTFDLRGFQGDYEVIVKRSGVPVQKETFFLGKADTKVNIAVTDSTDEISLSEEQDFVPQCISHRAQTTLGTADCSSTHTQLSCRTAKSGSDETGEAAVSCEADEVMTGCTSYDKMSRGEWTGQQIVMENGVPTCKAISASGGRRSVLVYAVCCRLSGLTCDYRTAGPSSPFDGAKAEATCPSDYTPVGCSSSTKYADFDGGYPDLDRNSCLAQSGAPVSSVPAERSGATAFSACCKAPGLTCQTVTSDESKLSAGKQTRVTCPQGYVMTACAVYAQSGKSDGGKISDREGGPVKCKAFLGVDLPDGSVGVRAIATCCTTTAT